MRHLALKEEIINRQKIWSKNTEEKRTFRKASVKEMLKKRKMCCALNSASSEYGPTVNAALNPLKCGEFLDRLGGCKLLKKYCPLRNQILTLQYGLFFVYCWKNQKFCYALRILSTSYIKRSLRFLLNVVKAFLLIKHPACSIWVKCSFACSIWVKCSFLPGVFAIKYVTY
jgi:hypothetical protein